MTTQASPAAGSALLLAANERLLALRRERGIDGDWTRSPAPAMGEAIAAAGSVSTSASVETSCRSPRSTRTASHIGQLLANLGSLAPAPPPACSPASGTRAVPGAPPSTVKVYPDLALAMLRGGSAAAGRVWLLLRAHDTSGSGRLERNDALRLLSADGSPQRIAARRQVTNLLRAGEGVYWETRDGRLWLRSVARVAAALGVARLAAAPVAVRLSGLSAGIGRARAELYATFHSSRAKEQPARTGRGRAIGPAPSGSPVARQTLSRLSQTSANTQRAYERRVGVLGRACYAVGPGHTPDEAREQAWTRGRAVFSLVDRAGRLGRPGARYVAWQLPNTYTGPHARLSRGRMQRINRRIAGLLDNGMTGNSAPATDARMASRKRYYGNGATVAAAERRAPAGSDLYWRGPGRLWFRVEASGTKPRPTRVLCQPQQPSGQQTPLPGLAAAALQPTSPAGGVF